MGKVKRKKLAAQDLAAFYESLAMLQHAGVPANECPGIVADDMQGSRLADAAEAASKTLSGGEIFELSKALESTGAFPEYAVEMTRIGEESGRLETIAEQLGAYYRRQEALRQSIRSVISGPVLLTVIMSAVLVFLISFVLPVFEDVFSSLGAGTASIGGAFTAARVAMTIACVLLGIIVIVLVMCAIPRGRRLMLALAQRLPGIKRIHYAVYAARFTTGLSMLLASAIPISQALKQAASLVENKRITDNVPYVCERVEKGEDLGKSMVAERILDGFEAKILLSASRAGQTEVAMQNLSNIYSDEADGGIERLLGMVEPVLVGILSVAIGVILLSVMLPLTTILSSIG